MRLVDDHDRQAVLDNLMADIDAHGDRLTTGDVGNRYLFRALLDNGQEELWYKMLNHYDVPGYGYQLKKGMTTLTEQWNPEHGASMNHFMMAHLNNHLLQDIAGICVVQGLVAMIAPTPVGDLTWARGSMEVAGSGVSVSWKKDGNMFLLDIDTPNKTKVVLPYSRESKYVSAGKHQFKEKIIDK